MAAARCGKTKTGEMRVVDAVAVLEEFQLDVESIYRIAEVSTTTTDRAVLAAERHRIRAYDCLQLATAQLLHEQRASFELATLVLVSSDAELNAAAESKGLDVEDPASGEPL